MAIDSAISSSLARDPGRGEAGDFLHRESGMSSLSGAFWTKSLFEGSPSKAALRFWAWYKSEFFAFFSPATIAWMFDRGDRKLIIRIDENSMEVVLAGAQGKSGTKIAPEELKTATLTDVLARHQLSRQATKIVLEIPRDKFFVRRFDVPIAARANLPRLLAAEIERKTPFRLSDVFYGYVLRNDPHAGKLHVEQWILRRDIVERALDAIGLSVDEFDLARPSGESDGAVDAPTIVLGQRTETSNWFRYAVIGLISAAIFLFVAGVGMRVWRQNQLGAELDAEIATASARAAQVRQLADRATRESALLATLRHEKTSTPVFAALWEEISRLLPDGAYVTEMRLSESKPGERVVDLHGFSDSAAGLPALIDQSPLFSDTALTAPITPDLNEKRERFSLQAKIRHKGVVKPK